MLNKIEVSDLAIFPEGDQRALLYFFLLKIFNSLLKSSRIFHIFMAENKLDMRART